MDELHRRLAHISVQRASTNDFVWSHAVRDWLPALIDALRRFISGLPPERRASFARADAMLSTSASPSRQDPNVPLGPGALGQVDRWIRGRA